MLRRAIVLGLVVVPALIGTSVAVAALPYFASDPPNTPGAPYSAVATTQSTTQFSDGTRITRGNTVHFFRDGQGRTRIERGLGADGEESASQANPLVRINDPVSGQTYTLYPQTKTAMVYKMFNRAGPRPVTVSTEATAPFALLGLGMSIGAGGNTESSLSQTSLGQKVISGVNATGTRTVRTIPSGVLGNDKPITSTRDEWVSTDLGVPVQITEKSSLGGAVTLNLSQVVRGEPDSTLFAPPADYTRHDLAPAIAAATAAVATTAAK